MGLDIWFLDDIRNAIVAANEASSATAEMAANRYAPILDLVVKELQAALPNDRNQVLLNALHVAAVGNTDCLRDYRKGFRAALVTLALAFGLSPAIIGQSGENPQKSPGPLTRPKIYTGETLQEPF